MHPKPRLWVVDPSLHQAEEQGVAEVLRDWPGVSRVFQPGLVRGDGPGPDTGHDAEGVVLMGSAASVYDGHDWLPPLAAWLRPVVRGDVRLPLLGICFGHQMIAHLANGRVDWLDADRHKLLGVETTRLAGGRLLPGEHRLRVVVSHREEVKRLPPGYRVTAARDGAAIDGLEHERLPVFSFQFHPEAREEFARRAGLEPTAIDDRVREDGRRVLSAFVACALREWTNAESS
jgi:GMP synthase-like glutamine amidotransferase